MRDAKAKAICEKPSPIREKPSSILMPSCAKPSSILLNAAAVAAAAAAAAEVLAAAPEKNRKKGKA